MSNFPKKMSPDERKQQIIDAATAVFSQKGFHQASMADIVAATGLSKGGVYWHFENKEAIITAVLDQFFQSEIEDATEYLRADQPASQKMAQMINVMVRDTEALLGHYRNIWLELYAVAAREGLFRERLLQYMNQFVDLYQALIQEGIDNGEFRRVPAREMAVMTIAQFEGLILLWAIQPEEVDMVSLSASAVDMILQSLKN